MFTILGADKKLYGPATVEQVREWIVTGRADAATLAQANSANEWKPLGTYPEFASLIAAPAAPPLLPPPIPLPRPPLPAGMPMAPTPPVPVGKKFSLLLGPPGPINRERAIVCAATNVALPGFGSLFGRRAIGYAQIVLTTIGFALTLFGGIATIKWYFSKSSELKQLQEQPELYLDQIWLHFRAPLLGMLVFIIALAWAWLTSRSLLAEARRNEQTELLTLPHKQ